MLASSEPSRLRSSPPPAQEEDDDDDDDDDDEEEEEEEDEEPGRDDAELIVSCENCSRQVNAGCGLPRDFYPREKGSAMSGERSKESSALAPCSGN